MTASEERPERPEPDEEQTWADLVQAFHAAPDDAAEHHWPAAEDLGPDDVRSDPYTPPPVGLTADDLLTTVEASDDGGDTLPGPRRAADDDPASLEADHFVPPAPPPMPPGDLVSRLAWAGVIVPPAVVLIAGLTSIGIATNVTAFLAVAFIAGFGTLVSRLRGHHPSDPDDGAVL